MSGVPRSDIFDDVYFSADDGPSETAHVFLNGNNLPARWQGRPRFSIGETGFGTGLNFLLAWELFERTAQAGAFLDFVSVEKYPMSAEDIRKGLSPWAERLSPYLEKMLAQYPIRANGFHRIVFDNRIALTLVFGDANDALSEIEGSVDAWFLDGFTPAKNPDMWTGKVFGEMARLSHGGTTFATFTSAGFVKRGLQEAGFTVEKQKGFGRKRDMLAGRFEGKPRADISVPKKIAIYGAGLAGTSAAYVLKQYGFEPVLVDPNGMASGASGNETGLINPRFTAFRGADSDFYTAGFAQTVRMLESIANYDRCGSLHLITEEEKEKRFTRTVENWGWNDAHMRILSADEASDVCGVKVNRGALYLPDSAQVNPARLCAFYAKDVPLLKEPTDADGVIYANGVGTLDLPTHTVRGQITFADASAESIKLKTNLCYGGYISAAKNGRHAIGSTFQKWLSHTDILPEDDDANIQNLEQNVPALKGLRSNGHRASLRVASKDRFPIIGQIGHNQFISTAHGSHGIVSTIAGAHLLADFLRGGIFSLGKSSINALSPIRFEQRAARKS